jgi:hypothetical protein
MIAGRIFYILFDSQIPLRGRKRGVAVGKLNLLNFCPALVSQFPVRPS